MGESADRNAVSITASSAKAWAGALVILLGGLISFTSSPNWPLAALITLVIASIVYLASALERCRNANGELRTQNHSQGQAIGLLYVIAETRSGGKRRRLPPLSLFLGAEADKLMDEVRAVLNEKDDPLMGDG